MRIGQNPAKSAKNVARPERITVAVLNYIPFLSGYYAEMLDVLKTCLNSIRESADLPYDLLVFDNGSCEEALQYLTDEKQVGNIQYLMLSEKNLGKGGAWNVMLSGAPGEIIVYTDNDVLFFPGWLSRSVQLLETFPNVGMVTARPYRTNSDYYGQTLSWAESNKEDVMIERGQLVPFEALREFNLSLGQKEEEIRRFCEITEDVRLTYHGVSAYVGASHWQFASTKKTMSQFLPFDMDRPMGQVKQLDQRVNAAGMLRLMVTDPLAMNLSNSLKKTKPANEKKKSIGRIGNIPFVRKTLLTVYDKIFKLYYK
jgi:hypothetical protein